jgi:hypothetical protein
MTIQKLKIADTDLDRIVNFLIGELNFDYENHSTDMSILLAETIHFRNSYGQANMVILKKEQSSILVDIIGCGGNIGLLGIVGNSEAGYTEKVAKVITRYAEELELSLEQE